MRDPSVQWLVGIDWASEEHEVCLLSLSGNVVGQKSFRHSGDGLRDLVTWLEQTAEGPLHTVAAALEVPHGAVVETLLGRCCQVYSINPKQLDRFRDRFSVSGAKDDRRDAYVLADSLRTDPHCFRRLHPEDPRVLQLREWSRIDEELKHERNRLCNRIREQLRRYFPAFLELSADVGEDWMLKLWRKIKTPDAATRTSLSVVNRLLAAHRIRRKSGSEVLETLRALPLEVAPGTVPAVCAHLELVVQRVLLVNEQIRQSQHELDRLLGTFDASTEGPADTQQTEQRDVAILQSSPGVGKIVLATLLAEAAEPLRQRDYPTLRALSGVAPITRRSGKSCHVVMRQACHPRLRNACYPWARVAAQCDPGSRAFYAALRARGKTHGRALRALADRLLRMACSMLRHGALFDPQRALAA